jgi:hypothetical protein
MRRVSLWPLFLVSAGAVGMEIALTRYFAVAKWSEYGYWVISIVMVGFALSGVAMAIARPWAERHGTALLATLPSALVLTAAGGYWLTTTNPFNPLQLQNEATWLPQLGNIFAYYAVLLPFFFLTGIFVSLNFVLQEDRVKRVYGFDLTGAGVGAALTLLLMMLLHPFGLVPALLVPIAAAAWFGPWPRRAGLAALLALLAAEAMLLGDPQAAFNDFKPIYAPLHVPDSKVVAQRFTPRGLYMLLDDFTERVDTDLSNDAANLKLPGPPRALGLYRDGNRIAALPMPDGVSAAYAGATLDAVAYAVVPHPRALLAGASGGFRIAVALNQGASSVTALEPDPVLRAALRHGLGPSPKLAADPRVHISAAGLLSAVRSGGLAGAPWDLIDLSSDFLDAGEANVTSFTADSIADDLRALAPGGVVSIPVSIREFPTYALRMMATTRAALLRIGVAMPQDNVIVARSAWNVRILVSRTPFTPSQIAAARAFCDARSFDLSWYPGIDIVAARANLYNDLPAVSFARAEVISGAGSEDAIADEAESVLRGMRTASDADFDLSPITLDRPFYYATLRLDRIGLILRRLELLPQAEIGQLVNLAVLAQAIVIALLVLLVPALAGKRLRAGGGWLRPILYFSALGFGFLFIEIWLIEQATLYLNDRSMAFAGVLTGMLIFSGLGSMAADRIGLNRALAVILLWTALMAALMTPFLMSTLDWPYGLKLLVVIGLLAPVSVALGVPFPTGLSRAGVAGTGFLPWAWGLNGAMSVVATPLANLIAVSLGFEKLLLGALLLYGVAAIAQPSARKGLAWQDSPSY